MSTKGDGEEEGEAEPPQMEREVEITIVVKAFRGDPLPVPEKTVKIEGEGGEGEGEGEEEETGPPPPLEELAVTFNLSMFNGESLTSDAITFIKPPKEPEEGEEPPPDPPEGEEPPPPELADEWSHTFTVTASINEDVACQLARSVDSSLGVHKEGLEAPMLLLPVDFTCFVAGDKKMNLNASLSSTELVQNPYNVTHFTVDVTTNEAFLTPGLEEKLNPLCITIVAAEDLPNHNKYTLMGTWKDGLNPRTKTITELRQLCKPAYCKYRFMSPSQPATLRKRTPSGEGAEPEGGGEEGEEGGEESDWAREVVTFSMPQDKNIRFKHKKVFMAGLMHPDDLIQHLKTTPLEIELHDRDHIPPPPAEAVGEEEEGAPPPIWSGLKSIDTSRAKEPMPQDPYAVCSVNMMPLCDGRTFLVERSNLWPKRIEYAAFSAHEKPTRGNWVDCGSVLIVKVDLRRPLQNAVLYPGGPFQRIVYRFQYANADLLQRISDLVIRINSAALGTSRAKKEPPAEEEEAHEAWEADKIEAAINPTIQAMVKKGDSLDLLDKALTTVELAPEHMQDPELDIITGVQVIDSNYRIFILEGLAGGGIARLLQEIPRTERNSREFKMLYNPEISFPKRLYSVKYNVEIKRIKLRETLHKLILKVDTYLEPKYMLTAWALMRLNEISQAGRMKKLRDLVLFPEVAQLEHMYKKLGDALSIEDLTGKKPVPKKAKRGGGGGGEEEMPALTSEELAAASAMPRPKAKAPTECKNPVYLSFLATHPPPQDFIASNIEAVRGEDREKNPEHALEYGEVYNYSGQFLQYGSIQADFQRQRYARDHGKIHWTYSKDLISGAFVLRDPDMYEREQRRKSKARWLTKEGFQYPKSRQPQDFWTYEEGLSDYRKAELKNEWVENEWNDIKKVAPVVLPDGQPDFKLRYNTLPQLFETDPAATRSVFAAESGAALEEQERKSKTYQDWQEKQIVQDKRFHILWNTGAGSAASLAPLLKDSAKTRYLTSMPKPDGCQPEQAFPGSMYTKDAYVDPSQTYIVGTYGTFLRFEEKSLEDPTPVTRWTEQRARGVAMHGEKPAIHKQDFKPFGNQTRSQWKHKDKLYSRPIPALTEGDKPPLLYRKPQAQNGGES